MKSWSEILKRTPFSEDKFLDIAGFECGGSRVHMSVAFFERERNATLLHGVRKADPTAQGQRTGTLGSGSGRRVSQSGGGNCHIEWPGSCLHDARCSGTILSFYFRPASVLHFPAKSPARLLPKHTTGQREDCRIDVLLPRGWCVGDRGGGG